MTTALPRPGDPDFNMFKDAVKWTLTDNPDLAKEPNKLHKAALEMTEDAKKKGFDSIDTYRQNPVIGQKEPGQYIDRRPGGFGQNGESGVPNEPRPMREPAISGDDAYKILKTAFDNAQAEEAKKASQAKSSAELAAQVKEVFTPGKAAYVEPEPAPPGAPQPPTEKKPYSLLEVNGEKKAFEAFGGAIAGGWKEESGSITASVFHPIKDATITQVGVSGTVSGSSLQSAQVDAQFVPYKDPNKIEGNNTTFDIAAGYNLTPGGGPFAKVNFNEGSMGNSASVELSVDAKGSSVAANGVIGTGRRFEAKDSEGQVIGTKREGEIAAAVKVGPDDRSGSLSYKSNDEDPGNPKAGIRPKPSSTSASISVADDQEKTVSALSTRFPLNGASVAVSASDVKVKATGDHTTTVGGSIGSLDGLNGIKASVQTAPTGTTTTVGIAAGTPTLNGSVTGTFAPEGQTTVNGKLNGQVATNVVVGADITYDAKQGNVYGKGTVAYNNPGGWNAGLSAGVDPNGAFAGMITAGVGDRNPPKIDPSKLTIADPIDIRVGRLQGQDKELYTQAYAAVERLNEELKKESKPIVQDVKRTALSLAALADVQEPPLAKIADVKMWGTKEQPLLVISDKMLTPDNEHARRFQMEPGMAASLNSQFLVNRMGDNNNVTQVLSSGLTVSNDPAKLNPQAQPENAAEKLPTHPDGGAAGLRPKL